MNKRANTEYPIHDLIAERWSPRAFADKPVTGDVVGALVEAGRWASSSFNEQPWRFIIATRQHRQEHERLASTLAEANRLWAAQAPLLIVSVASVRFSRNDKPNRHAYHDVGQAVAQMIIEATHRGLAAHQMAGFDTAKVRELYALDDSLEPVAAIALGYPGDASALPEQLAEREGAPRTRKLLDELVLAGTWR